MKFLTSTVGATVNCPDGAVHFIAFVAGVASSDNASPNCIGWRHFRFAYSADLAKRGSSDRAWAEATAHPSVRRIAIANLRLISGPFCSLSMPSQM